MSSHQSGEGQIREAMVRGDVWAIRFIRPTGLP